MEVAMPKSFWSFVLWFAAHRYDSHTMLPYLQREQVQDLGRIRYVL